MSRSGSATGADPWASPPRNRVRFAADGGGRGFFSAGPEINRPFPGTVARKNAIGLDWFWGNLLLDMLVDRNPLIESIN